MIGLLSRPLARLRQLRASTDGNVMIEFALIGPTFIAMMFGVLQFGIGMQNYNAMRSAAADAARYAVVAYQGENNLTNIQIESYARSVATTPPYGLLPQRFNVSVGDAAVQRVAGVRELEMTMEYRIPTILTVIGMEEIPINYSRPIFLINN
jgi:Flp pilus assembly protein TadG